MTKIERGWLMVLLRQIVVTAVGVFAYMLWSGYNDVVATAILVMIYIVQFVHLFFLIIMALLIITIKKENKNLL